jgi:hypothetical protein
VKQLGEHRAAPQVPRRDFSTLLALTAFFGATASDILLILFNLSDP